MRTLSALLLLSLLAGGCFGDGDGGNDDNETPADSPYTGRFLIAATLTGSSCAVTTPLDNTYANITVEDDTLGFGTWAVAWDNPARRAIGTTPPQAVPIGTPPGCIGYSTVMLDFTYANVDSFAGTVLFSHTYSAECGASPCSYAYQMTGKRQP